jgi:hypothetical protein
MSYEGHTLDMGDKINWDGVVYVVTDIHNCIKYGKLFTDITIEKKEKK